MLNRGKGNREQVIAENWIDEMIKQRTTSKETLKNIPIYKNRGVDLGYGYMWPLRENTNDKRLKMLIQPQGQWVKALQFIRKLTWS